MLYYKGEKRRLIIEDGLRTVQHHTRLPLEDALAAQRLQFDHHERVRLVVLHRAEVAEHTVGSRRKKEADLPGPGDTDNQSSHLVIVSNDHQQSTTTTVRRGDSDSR